MVRDPEVEDVSVFCEEVVDIEGLVNWIQVFLLVLVSMCEHEALNHEVGHGVRERE